MKEDPNQLPNDNASNESDVNVELEVRIVALVLGETSASEREELERLIDQRAELQAFRQEIENVHGVLKDVGDGDWQPESESADWKLTNDSRAEVLTQIADSDPPLPRLAATSPQNVSVKRSWLWNQNTVRSLAKIAAVLCLAAFFGQMLLVPPLQMARDSARVGSSDKSLDIALYSRRDVGGEASAELPPNRGYWFSGGAEFAVPALLDDTISYSVEAPIAEGMGMSETFSFEGSRDFPAMASGDSASTKRREVLPDAKAKRRSRAGATMGMDMGMMDMNGDGVMDMGEMGMDIDGYGEGFGVVGGGGGMGGMDMGMGMEGADEMASNGVVQGMEILSDFGVPPVPQQQMSRSAGVASKNEAIRSEMDNGNASGAKTNREISSLVETFNDLMDENRFEEGEVIAKQIQELKPNSPVAMSTFHASRMQSRIQLDQENVASSEDGLARQMLGVGRAAIAPDPDRPFSFQDPVSWEELSRRRLAAGEISRSKGMASKNTPNRLPDLSNGLELALPGQPEPSSQMGFDFRGLSENDVPEISGGTMFGGAVNQDAGIEALGTDEASVWADPSFDDNLYLGYDSGVQLGDAQAPLEMQGKLQSGSTRSSGRRSLERRFDFSPPREPSFQQSDPIAGKRLHAYVKGEQSDSSKLSEGLLEQKPGSVALGLEVLDGEREFDSAQSQFFGRIPTDKPATLGEKVSDLKSKPKKSAAAIRAMEPEKLADAGEKWDKEESLGRTTSTPTNSPQKQPANSTRFSAGSVEVLGKSLKQQEGRFSKDRLDQSLKNQLFRAEEKARLLNETVGTSKELKGARQEAINFFEVPADYKNSWAIKIPASKPPVGLDEKSTAQEAFSTFSLHVGDVSFKLAQSALAGGSWPEPAKVRIEEFVNALDYGDPLPSQAERVACRVEQAVHPFLQQRNLLRCSMRTAATGRASTTPLRLTFLLDNSGSMERMDRQETVRRAFALLAGQLQGMDQVTLISFARKPRLLADKVDGTKAAELVRMIENLPSEGGTNLEAALKLAFEKAREQQTTGAQNRIILLTDGAVNLGDANPESLSNLIETMRSQGIAFDAAGIGADGLNDEILEALTRKGDGRYYLLDSAEAADDGFARQIAGALRPAAMNVKVQVEFNPERVGQYKLLGFEKHRLAKEDFRNDKVDAAEMAAAEAGVAVYQFEAKPNGQGDVGSVSVRFRDVSTGKMIENRWPIPYQSNALRLDESDPSMRMAAAAALFAAKLRGDGLGQLVDLKSLALFLADLPDQGQSSKRINQLQQMIQQARQLEGE